MKRGIISLTVGLVLASTWVIPAFAEDSTPSGSDSPTSASTPKEPKKGKTDKTKTAPEKKTQESSDASQSPAPADAAATPDKTTPATKTHNFKASKLPGAAVAFTAGVLVGTPIAIVRKCKTEGIIATRELCGETNNPLIFGPCAALGMPGGWITGILVGTFDGVTNSAKNCVDEPYSKDSFSLGELK